MFHRPHRLGLALGLLLFLAAPSPAQPPAKPKTDPPKPEAAKDTGPAPGHSMYGEEFSEGPRQRGYLMVGTGHVRFPVTAKSEEAKKFVAQGVGQLHGFWYLEAERSFRQAMALDPDCAMAYWGLTFIHRNTQSKAKVFIQKALDRKAKVTPREVAWIDALNAFVQHDPKDDRGRLGKWIAGLEAIVQDYPDDIEAKAFFVWLLWEASNRGVPIGSRQAVEALAQQVLAVEPDHPVHHYLIHMWDAAKPARALPSAAKCGPGSFGIAHMWHMPAHIYDKLGRWGDAAWQLEASSRVDHAYMIRDRVLPYDIHNYGHNQEWLTRNLMHVGRARDALAVALSLAEVPQHPTLNNLGKGGVAAFGRDRLFDVLTRFELWDDVLDLAKTSLLDTPDSPEKQAAWVKVVGRAHLAKGQAEQAKWDLQVIESILTKLEGERRAAGEEAEKKAAEAKKPADQVKKARDAAEGGFKGRTDAVKQQIDELEGWLRLADGRSKEAAEALAKANGLYGPQLARAYLEAGQLDKAEQTARRNADGDNKVLPLAVLIEVLARKGDKKDEVARLFTKLRTVAGQADPDLIEFGRLAPIAKELGLPTDWRTPAPPAKDLGPHPNLDTLGPLRWKPSPAPEWSLIDPTGKPVHLADYHGRPVVVIFYLGAGCMHCVEQLRKFTPLARDFEAAGITLLAISSEGPEALQRSAVEFARDGGVIAFPLLTDPGLATFKAYRTYDDFEGQPLHGTFLIDGHGLIRWQDIGHEPYADPKFLLTEAKRLLSLPEGK